MKKYIYTFILVVFVALVGGIVYLTIPKDDVGTKLNIYAEDFSMVVNEQKQIRYTLSVNPALVFVEMHEDDSNILTIEQRDDGTFVANSHGVGATTVTISARYGSFEAMKIITISVVSDQSQIIATVDPPETFEEIVRQTQNCSVSGNVVNISVGEVAVFTIAIEGVNIENLYFENTNSNLSVEEVDVVMPFMYEISTTQAGSYAIRFVLNNNTVYNVSVVAE